MRDQIHANDVIRAFEQFAANPRPGEVYNLGGGRSNSASVLECIQLIEEVSGHKLNWSYSDQNRLGDHICYISDMTKFKSHYPAWQLTRRIDDIVEEIIAAETARRASPGA